MMLRLSLLDDIIEYAGMQGDEMGLEAGASRKAALEVQEFSVIKLSKWLRKSLIPALDARLDYDRYSNLARELHQDVPANGQAG
jgi:hypothetical protein